MDEKTHLIIIDEDGTWKDKTPDIVSLQSSNNRIAIDFGGGKIYPYSAKRVQLFEEPERIDLTKYDVFIPTKILKNGEVEVLNFGEHICVFENSRKLLYTHSEVKIIDKSKQSQLENDVIAYLAKIAELKKNEPMSKHLDIYYKRFVGGLFTESVASNFANQREPACRDVTDTLIFPFGINLSQRVALKNAIHNQISLIQGPPGTGKTQTILNLIANLLIRGKTIAVAAGNNSAVANVLEKLKKEELGFIAASLGSKDNVKQFFSLPAGKPNFDSWLITEDEREEVTSKLLAIDSKISTLLDVKNESAKTRSFLDKLKLEQRYFLHNFDVSPLGLKRLSLIKKWQSQLILDFMADFEYYSQFERLGWVVKLKWLFKYGVFNYREFFKLDDKLFKRIICEYYDTRIKEVRQSLDRLEAKLEGENFDVLLSKQTDYSLKLFKGFIASKYDQKKHLNFSQEDYKRRYKGFVEQYPLTLSTTDSLISNKPNTELFDYLIVDEASQVNLVSGFLAMCCAKNMVIVGDTKQLPHIASDELPVNIKHEFGVGSPYDYKSHSLLSSFVELFPNISSVLLREHYRCHPRIIEFCNQKYYDGKLVVMTEGGGEPFTIIKTEKGNHAARPRSGKGFINQREIDVIQNEVLPKERNEMPSQNIGIITPYREQANKFSSQLNVVGVDADTVHKFQGRERDTIIFSTTANKINRHLDQPELINVTVSRAKNRIILVSSDDLVKEHGTHTGDLMRYIEYQSESSAIHTSSTVSIFDCLYSEYSEKLSGFMRKVKKRSAYPSQDLMYALIDEVFQEGLYSSLSFKTDYQLSVLIKNLEYMNDREIQFIQNTSSHVDFIIYNKMDLLPVLAIEVDGYQFHQLNPKQLDRDAVKDSIFKKVNIPLVRFSTKGSGEKERLISLLSPWEERI